MGGLNSVENTVVVDRAVRTCSVRNYPRRDNVQARRGESEHSNPFNRSTERWNSDGTVVSRGNEKEGNEKTEGCGWIM